MLPVSSLALFSVSFLPCCLSPFHSVACFLFSYFFCILSTLLALSNMSVVLCLPPFPYVGLHYSPMFVSCTWCLFAGWVMLWPPLDCLLYCKTVYCISGSGVCPLVGYIVLWTYTWSEHVCQLPRNNIFVFTHGAIAISKMSAAAAAVPVLSWNFHCLEGVGGDLVGEASVGTIILSRK